MRRINAYTSHSATPPAMNVMWSYIRLGIGDAHVVIQGLPHLMQADDGAVLRCPSQIGQNASNGFPVYGGPEFRQQLLQLLADRPDSCCKVVEPRSSLLRCHDRSCIREFVLMGAYTVCAQRKWTCRLRTGPREDAFAGWLATDSACRPFWRTRRRRRPRRWGRPRPGGPTGSSCRW